MRLQFIGCGDAFGSGGRCNTCFHVVGDNFNFLIDCGASSLPALERFNIVRNEIDLILITHFHGDHFAGLPFFILDAQFGNRTRPLVIAGPQGIKARLQKAMEVMFEYSSQTRQKFELSIVSLEPEQKYRFGTLEVLPYSVLHGKSGGPFLGYRITAEKRIIAYSADTEWTETLVPLGHAADLFIVEAYTYNRIVKNHLSLGTLEENLPKIAPKQLILTHMSGDMLGFIGPLRHLTARDGMIVEI